MSKPTRFVREFKRPEGKDPGILIIGVNGDESVYKFQVAGAPMGGFHFLLEKEDGTRYDILIGDNPQDHLCDCPGHTYHGRCKHVEALIALLARVQN